MTETAPIANPFSISATFPTTVEHAFALWTSTEELAHWFGPQGTKIVVSNMDFRPGGLYHFCMELPNGARMWGKWLFREIDTPAHGHARLVWEHSFSDEAGGYTHHPMAADWPLILLTTVTFDADPAGVSITVQWLPERATPAEITCFNAMHDATRQGWTGTFAQLRAYLQPSA